MLELSLFLSIQIATNLIVKWIGFDRLSYVFVSLSHLLFGILILAYPIWSWRIMDFLFPPADGVQCANMQMGAAIFQWAVGIPLVLILQSLLNRYSHRIKDLLKKFEKPT